MKPMRIESRNPYTGQVLEELDAMRFEDSAREILAARKAFLSSKTASVQERAGTLRAVSQRLRDQQSTLARAFALNRVVLVECPIDHVVNCGAFSLELGHFGGDG